MTRHRVTPRVLVICGILGLGTVTRVGCSLDPGTRSIVQRTRSISNMKIIAMGLAHYHEVHGCLPPAIVKDKKGQPLYNWRVPACPFVGSEELYKKYKLAEPWDSALNRAVSDAAPSVYRSPRSEAGPQAASYVVAIGPNTPWPADRSCTIPAKAAWHTVVLVEVVQWTKPWASPADPNVDDLVARLAKDEGKEVDVLLAFASGHVCALKRVPDKATLKRLFSMDAEATVMSLRSSEILVER